MSSNQVPAAGTVGFPAIFIGTSHAVTTSGSSQVVSLLPSTSLVRLFATKDCFIDIQKTPVATSSRMFLPGGIVEYFGVQPGQNLAVLQVSASGVLYVTEGS